MARKVWDNFGAFFYFLKLSLPTTCHYSVLTVGMGKQKGERERRNRVETASFRRDLSRTSKGQQPSPPKERDRVCMCVCVCVIYGSTHGPRSFPGASTLFLYDFEDGDTMLPHPALLLWMIIRSQVPNSALHYRNHGIRSRWLSYKVLLGGERPTKPP